MIDGFATGYLPVEAYRLANKIGVDITPQTVYAKVQGLNYGFMDRVDKSTGEIRKMSTLHGSLHKYANAGLHNADSFRMSDLCRVFTELLEVYSINPDNIRLRNVEFGVNIKLPYDPRRVLKAIRMYRGYTLTPTGKFGFEYRTKEYRFKIYDKGRQCGVPGFENVLRIEVKGIVSYLKREKVHVPTLGDLLNVNVWKRFETILLEAIENTMIVEDVPFGKLTKKETALFVLFLGDGWQSLNRSVLYKKKKQFAELARCTGADSIKEEIKRLIAEKCQELRDVIQETDDGSGISSIGEKVRKVNRMDKLPEGTAMKLATFRTFFESAEKGNFGDISEVKIKCRDVAKSTPISTSTFAVHEAPQCIAKLSHIATLEVKARGRPPNRNPITMPLKRVLTNQNQPNEQRRIYSNRLHNQFRNRAMCGRAIRSARLLFLHNKQHRQRDIPSH